MRHRIAHWFGWNLGTVQTFTHHGIVWVCFVCSGCGRRSGLHAAPGWLQDL